jgi:hypothetical protein
MLWGKGVLDLRRCAERRYVATAFYGALLPNPAAWALACLSLSWTYGASQQRLPFLPSSVLSACYVVSFAGICCPVTPTTFQMWVTWPLFYLAKFDCRIIGYWVLLTDTGHCPRMSKRDHHFDNTCTTPVS